MRSLEDAASVRSVPERIIGFLRPTVRYLFTIESHVYAMAIAASLLLAFFPFLVLILSLTRALLPGSDVGEMVLIGVEDFLPKDPGLVSFVKRNVSFAASLRGQVEVVSTIALVISSQGIFMPLEVALNRLWRFPDDRSYWANQLASFLFAMACGVLALGAAVFSSANVNLVRTAFDNLPVVPEFWKVVVLKLASLPFVTTIFLLIYWKLPHGPVRFRTVAPVALWTAIAVEVAHALYLWAWPLLKVREAYGPFFVSVTVLLGGFVGAMIVLAGGEFCVRRGHKLARS
ncbi:MAG: YihY/virulence factor BrkB family protein [Acidobacteria bacterium]|nr:YihY/virulence factor BrkB family protein [Acidobacteriota bacterium]